MAKSIMAIGRITGSNREIRVEIAPSIAKRALASAKWFGTHDAENGQPCRPEKYFAVPEMRAAYIEGWNS